MVCALAASHLGISIPFGAAHRVNFDTPPLRGRCRAPRALLVYRLEPTAVTKWERSAALVQI
jgi:hypothetical protein